MATLKFKNINKNYPSGVHAVHDFNLEVNKKEFIVLVGPSGCGKSTTLRMIAGLESISSGEFYIDDVLVNNLAPSERDIAMIFQDYALYGNMTVYENMGFSLEVRKIDPDIIYDKVSNAAQFVNLRKELNRLPRQLSGGQRQRVALGRSIVRDAKIFLMDEPLSNLDAKLRLQTRRELIKMYHQLNSTVIYVTHDQIEAMTMATRIVVMNNGYVQQIGTPLELYQKPKNLFVAEFIGTPNMNFIKGNYSKGYFINDFVKLKLNSNDLKYLEEGKEIIIGIRPEDIKVTDEKINEESIKAEIDLAELMGATYNLKFNINDTKIIAVVNSNRIYQNHENLYLNINVEKLHYFDPLSTLNLKGCDLFD